MSHEPPVIHPAVHARPQTPVRARARRWTRRARIALSILLIAPAGPAAPALAGGGAETFEAFESCEHGAGCLHGKLLRAHLYGALDGLAWDPDSGRDLRNFPPDPVVDYLHMRLEMRFEDLDQPHFVARETLHFHPIAGPVERLDLDAVELSIRRVTLENGDVVDFFHDGRRLTLRFDPPLPADRPHAVVIDYACTRPWAGMVFTPSAPDAPGYGPEVHTQGQTEHNRHWFVAHDFPNDMLTTELVVDVPAGFQVSGNGRLVAHEVRDGRETWHWLQDAPHVTYLVSLVIGRFDRVPLDHPRVEMTVWVPEGLGHLVPGTYGRTGAMIDVFEHWFGLPYPWARYDQLVVRNFGAGGMENTSATSMYPSAIFDGIALHDADLDGLISHELAHQWTGDLLTCRSWEHIWLNEGWATYATALWYEARDGREGYLDAIRGSFGVARRDLPTHAAGMASPLYTEAWETFRRPANPYPKGASVLHMLRCMLGDELFRAGTHLYMQRHAHTPVETDDFRRAMEDVSGLSLEWYFDQWCRRPGSPDLHVTTAFDPAENAVVIEIEQRQHQDARTPAKRFDLPVVVRTDEGEHRYAIAVRERRTVHRRPIRGMPRLIAIDPDLHVLKRMEETKAAPLWREQVRSGPTIAARHDAAEALARTGGDADRALLLELLHDTSTRHTLRRTAAQGLRRMGGDALAALLATLDEPGDVLADPRVRLAVIEALEDLPRDRAVPRLARAAAEEASYAIRARAIDGLRTLKAVEELPLLRRLVDVPSQHEQIRTASLRALAALGGAEALPLALRHARFGTLDRARPPAIEAVGKLAHHDPDTAVPFLIALLDDPERRSLLAAGSALAEIGDARALARIRAMAESHPAPPVRREAEKWLERLRVAADA